MPRKTTTHRRSNIPGASTGAKAAPDRPTGAAAGAAGQGRAGAGRRGQAATGRGRTGAAGRKGSKTRIPRKKTAGYTHDVPLEGLLSLLGASSGTGDSQLPAERLLERCERLIAEMDAGALQVAILLAIVQRDRLYKDRGYKSVRDYAEQHLAIPRPTFYHLMAGSSVLQDLYNCMKFSILPQNECQTRALSPLTKEERIAVWALVLAVTAGARITGKIIDEQAEKYLKKQAIQTPDEPGIGRERSPDLDLRDADSLAGSKADDEIDPDRESDQAEPAQSLSDLGTPSVGKTSSLCTGCDNYEASGGIELTDRGAQEGNSVALIFDMMKDGKPHPPPSRWNVSPTNLLAAYVFQPDSPVEQRKRLWATGQAVSREACVGRGRAIVNDTFLILARTPLLKRASGQDGMWQATALWLNAERTPSCDGQAGG